MADGEQRRYLIATAVTHYPHAPQWDLPNLAAARDEIVELFTGALGYTHVSDLGLDPTKLQLTEHLRAFCRSDRRRPDDLVAVYIGGHGEILDDGGEHVLLTSDTQPEDIEDALLTVELARKMLRGTNIRRLLLLLDTCYSGQGGNELAAAALTRMTQQWGEQSGSGLVVVTSAQPLEQAEVGAFPRLLREAVHRLPTAGHAPVALALPSVVEAMNSNPDRPPFQRIGWMSGGLTGELPPFLANPRHDPQLTEVDLRLQQDSEREEQADQRDTEFRTRLLVRAMAGHSARDGWWFAGRHEALTELNRWLAAADRARPILAVTGGPGSGKTAVLGLVAALTHPERRSSVPRDALGLPAVAVPTTGAVDVAIYAQNLTDDQVLHGIAASARVDAQTVGELIDGLAGRPFTVLVDAVDEAATPETLAARVLKPMAEHGGGRLRLLVGTRPHLLSRLGIARADSLDLDSDRYADLPALTGYAARGLLESVSDSPYLTLPAQTTRAVAEAVAQAAHPSFLVARITSASLAADPRIPDAGDPGWRASLPQFPGDAMRLDLESRLGPDATKARDLLRPLAFAQGQGLPWEDLWAPLAGRLAGCTYTDDDVLWLRRRAGSYVVEATEADRSAYRLYHAALGEHLREHTDPTTVHNGFFEVLLSRVPRRIDGSRDWARAHPYALRHIATHAVLAGRIDELVGDLDYLVRADPETLLPTLGQVGSEAARLIRAIYRSSASRLRELDPLGRRQILAIDAARYQAGQHARAFAEPLEWAPRWATGHQTDTGLDSALAKHLGPVDAAAGAIVDGMPVAVTCYGEGSVNVWDLRTGTQRAELIGHGGKVNAVATTMVDGRPVAVTSDGAGSVRVWDLATGMQRAELAGHTRWVNAVACTVIDGAPVAVTGDGDGSVRVWDLITGTQRAELVGHDRWVNAVACTTVDGRPVAVTADGDGWVRTWDLDTSLQRAELTRHPVEVNALACTTVDGQPIAITADGAGRVQTWDLATGTRRSEVYGWAHAMTCTTIDGRPVAVSGNGEGVVQVWDLRGGTESHEIGRHAGWVRAVACTVIDGTPVALTADGGGGVRIWDLRGETLRAELIGRVGSDLSAVGHAVVAQRPVVVSGDGDGLVRLWDLDTGGRLAELTGHAREINALACTEVDGEPVALTADGSGSVRMWDLGSAGQRAELVGHKGKLNAVACTEVGGRPVAVTTDSEGSVRVWDLLDAEQRASLVGHTRWVNAVACTVIDGAPVAVTGDGDGSVRVWDLTTGTQRAELIGHERWVNAVACAAVDGRPVAVTGDGAGSVRVWDLTSGVQRAELVGHTRWVNAVAGMVIDGRPVAVTADGGGSVRLWDLYTGAQRAELLMPQSVGTLAVSPRNALLIGSGWELIVLDRQAR